MKISGVYKITNTITGDFYIGSSKDVKSRWVHHKCKSTWKNYPNNPMYLDMKKYGIDKFEFEILAEVEIESLKEKEQEFIEKLNPTYNDKNANGYNIERKKESQRKASRKYRKSDKYKKTMKEYRKEYRKTNKYKEYQKEYAKSDKRIKYNEEYNNQLCFYSGETLTLRALSARFMRRGIDHPVLEAKKYLIKD